MFGKAADALLNEPVTPEGWSITHDPKSIPKWDFDYNFSHESQDFYNDDTQHMWGFGSSIADCIAQINVIIDEGVE